MPENIRMELLASPGRRRRWEYVYRNSLREPVDLWVSMPRRRPGQGGFEILALAGDLCSVDSVAFDGRALAQSAERLSEVLNDDSDAGVVNTIARFRITAGSRVRILLSYSSRALCLVPSNASARLARHGWAAVQQAGVLAPEECEYYLRSAPRVTVDAGIEREAVRLAGSGGASSAGEGADAVLSRIGRLYHHITSATFEYRWPSPTASSTDMQERKAGDCGSYAFLFTAWCRALRIPARVVVGSWARGSMEGHVWSEVFVDTIGWIPVDPTMGALLRQDPARHAALLDCPAGHPRPARDAFLGSLDRGRLAFSVDANPHALPGYEEWSTPPDDSATRVLPGEALHWGYELDRGTVPYLQPAYPRYGEPIVRASDAVLLGTWRFPTRSRIPLQVVSWLSVLLGGGLLVMALADERPLGEDTAVVTVAAFAVFAAARSWSGHHRVANLLIALALLAFLLFG